MNTFKLVIETISLLKIISQDYMEDPCIKKKSLKKLLEKQEKSKKAIIQNICAQLQPPIPFQHYRLWHDIFIDIACIQSKKPYQLSNSINLFKRVDYAMKNYCGMVHIFLTDRQDPTQFQQNNEDGPAIDLTQLPQILQLLRGSSDSEQHELAKLIEQLINAIQDDDENDYCQVYSIMNKVNNDQDIKAIEEILKEGNKPRMICRKKGFQILSLHFNEQYINMLGWNPEDFLNENSFNGLLNVHASKQHAKQLIFELKQALGVMNNNAQPKKQQQQQQQFLSLTSEQDDHFTDECYFVTESGGRMEATVKETIIHQKQGLSLVVSEVIEHDFLSPTVILCTEKRKSMEFIKDQITVINKILPPSNTNTSSCESDESFERISKVRKMSNSNQISQISIQ